MKRFKSIFLSNNPKQIDYVYSAEQQKRIAEPISSPAFSRRKTSIPRIFRSWKLFSPPGE